MRTGGASGSALGLLLLAALSPAKAQDAGGEVRGLVKAVQEAVITVDLKARVAEAPLRTGEAFRKGDVLIRFDCEARKAEREAMRAAHSAARARFESNAELMEYDAAGKLDVDLSRAEMDEAAARSRAAAARLKGCALEAPFDGRVADLFVNAHETPSPDAPLLKIVSDADLELRLIAPSAWLGWLAPGQEFEFEIDETGERLGARVVRIGAEVDAVSRTVPVIAVFNEHPESVLPGMSGAARFVRAEG